MADTPPDPTAIEADAAEATADSDAAYDSAEMVEGNGSPTLGELGRNIDALGRRFDGLDAKVDRIASSGIETRLDEVNRRLGNLERTGRDGANRNSSNAWQVLFLVLGGLIALAVGAVAGSLR